MAENGGSELTRRQQRALVALVTAPTLKAAAKAAGIGERTLQRYVTLPEFQRALARQHDEMAALAMARLDGLLQKSFDVLGLDFEPGAGAEHRLRAASIVLRHYAALRVYADLARRVLELESRRQQK